MCACRMSIILSYKMGDLLIGSGNLFYRIFKKCDFFNF